MFVWQGSGFARKIKVFANALDFDLEKEGSAQMLEALSVFNKSFHLTSKEFGVLEALVHEG